MTFPMSRVRLWFFFLALMMSACTQSHLQKSVEPSLGQGSRSWEARFKFSKPWPFKRTHTFIQKVTVSRRRVTKSFLVQMTLSAQWVEGIIFLEGMEKPLYQFHWAPDSFEGKGLYDFEAQFDVNVFCLDFLSSMMPLSWLEEVGFGSCVQEVYKKGTKYRYVDFKEASGQREIIYGVATGPTSTFEIINPTLGYTVSIQTVEG